MNTLRFRLAATVILVLLATTQVANATPRISWSRDLLARFLVPGTSASEQMSFQSNVSLTNVDLVIVPAIAAYVQPNPAHFARVVSGRPYTITLSITVPSTMPTGSVLEGTVQLRSGGNTISVPLSLFIGVDVDSARQPDPNKLVQDGNVRYPVNEVLAILSPGCGPVQGQQVAASLHGTVVGFLQELNAYQILTQTSTVSALNSLITQTQTGSCLLGLTKNYIMDLPQGPVAFTDLQNLFAISNDARLIQAYLSVGVPQAWNLLRSIGQPSGFRDVTIGDIDTGVAVSHPEFLGVRFGHTPSLARSDEQGCGLIGLTLVCGHGTEVAGILGGNNVSDSNPTAYLFPQMSGVLAGIPQYGSRYTLEERNWKNATFFDQLFFTGQLIRAGIKVVLLELEFRLDKQDPQFTNNLWNARLWFSLLSAHSDVLFVLPAGNYGINISSVSALTDIALCTEVVGCINLPNTITVGAFDPFKAEDDPEYTTNQISDFGPAVELAGPGMHVYAPQAPPASPYTDPIGTQQFSGTSAAAPFVAGAAGMILAIAPEELSPTDLKKVLVAPPPNGGGDVIPATLLIGNRINVCRAIRNVLGFPTFQLNSSTPANGSSSIPIDSSILLNFSAPIDAQQFSTQLQVFSGSAQQVSGMILVLNQQSVEFIPTHSLQLGTAYLVDLRSVTDICVDRLSGSTAVSFTTALPVLPLPDLTITKTASPSPVTSGGTLTYTITAQNAAGTAAALNVTVTDPLPTGVSFTSCSVSTGGCSALNGTVTALFGTLAGGASATLTISTTAPTVSTSMNITNTAAVSADNEPAANTGNNQASVVVNVHLRSRRLYVTNPYSNSVTAIDTASSTAIASVPVGTHPDGIVISPDGGKVYVVNEGSNTISVVDTLTNTVSTTIVFATTPFGVAITPDGKYLYVSSTASGTVSVVDTAVGAVTATISDPAFPQEIAITPDGTRAYVANGEHSVSVVDTATNNIVNAVGLLPGLAPFRIAITADGTRAYVVDGTFYTTYLIDTLSNTVLISNILTYAWDLAVAPDGKRVYLSERTANNPSISDRIEIIDTATNSIAFVTLTPGIAPTGLAVTPDGATLYLAGSNSGLVYVIDTSTMNVRGTVPAGAQPLKMVLTP